MGIRLEPAWWRWRQRARRFPGRFEEPSWHAGDHERLLAASLDWGGANLTQVSEPSAARAGQYSFDDAPSLLGLVPGTLAYDRALAELRERGYTILPWLLDKDRADLLSEHLSSPELTLIGDDPSLDGRPATISFAGPLAEKYDEAVSDILSSSEAVSLVLDRGVLRAAQDYLGSVPKIEICAWAFSLPASRASTHAATVFHFDLDRTRCLKILLSLTDVTPSTGADVFLPGIQRDNAVPLNLRNRGYARMTGDDVRAGYQEEMWTTIRGGRGTILLKDTREVHKGLPVPPPENSRPRCLHSKVSSSARWGVRRPRARSRAFMNSGHCPVHPRSGTSTSAVPRKAPGDSPDHLRPESRGAEESESAHTFDQALPSPLAAEGSGPLITANERPLP